MAQYSGIFTLTQQSQAQGANNWASLSYSAEILVVAGGGGAGRLGRPQGGAAGPAGVGRAAGALAG